MPKMLLVQDLLEEFHQMMKDFDGSSIQRDAKFSSIPKKIKVAIGMRRTGKTYFLLQKIHYLQLEQIPLSQILYLNFEDDRLLPSNQEKLRALIDQFYTLYPENHDKLCHFFFDEIQNVDNWPQVIRSIFDNKKVHIYLSGSSAKLLSKEIASSLRGRSAATEIWPFSFEEYLRAKKATYSDKLMSKNVRDQLMRHLTLYLNQGGFPETIHIKLGDRIGLLQNYVDVVIFRDIIERHKITNIALVKYLIKFLLKSTSGSFSMNKFYNDLKSQGLAVGKTTLHDYLAYIEDAYLIFTVPLFSESLRKVHSNPRKIYAIDNGLVNAYTSSFSKNYGRLFENLIYLDLRRKGHEVFYYLTQERHEVDFLSKDKYGKLHLYQVVWDNSAPETLAREKGALHAAEKELGIKGKIISPLDYLTDSSLFFKTV